KDCLSFRGGRLARGTAISVRPEPSPLRRWWLGLRIRSRRSRLAREVAPGPPISGSPRHVRLGALGRLDGEEVGRPMVSLEKVAATRRNAQRSTGPRTLTGKRASAGAAVVSPGATGRRTRR